MRDSAAGSMAEAGRALLPGELRRRAPPKPGAPASGGGARGGGGGGAGREEERCPLGKRKGLGRVEPERFLPRL